MPPNTDALLFLEPVGHLQHPAQVIENDFWVLLYRSLGDHLLVELFDFPYSRFYELAIFFVLRRNSQPFLCMSNFYNSDLDIVKFYSITQ